LQNLWVSGGGHQPVLKNRRFFRRPLEPSVGPYFR